MVFPEAVAVTQETVGEPMLINGLDVEPVLSLPTTMTLCVAGVDPLEEENVLKAGLPNRTGTLAAVTRSETGTVALPPDELMVMVAV
jgi:hypothetical protein